MQDMTSIEDLEPAERKRQREALRRRMAQPGHVSSARKNDPQIFIAERNNEPWVFQFHSWKNHSWKHLHLQRYTNTSPLTLGGLRPGLLQKYNAATTPSAKFEFLRAFMLDPQNMADVSIEAEYVNQSQHDESSQWAELPLATLRKSFTTPEEKKFLMEQVVGKQHGTPHPQDPQNPEMRLYWIFREGADTSRSRTSIGTRLTTKSQVPNNKAARTAVADALVGIAADFKGNGKGHPCPNNGKGEGGQPSNTNKRNGTAKGENKGETKTNKRPKVGLPRFGIGLQEQTCSTLRILMKITSNVQHASPFDPYFLCSPHLGR